MPEALESWYSPIPDIELAVLTGSPEAGAQAAAVATGLVRTSGLWRQPLPVDDAPEPAPVPDDSARDARLLALVTRVESAGLAAPSAEELGWHADPEVPALLREGERRGAAQRRGVAVGRLVGGAADEEQEGHSPTGYVKVPSARS